MGRSTRSERGDEDVPYGVERAENATSARVEGRSSRLDIGHDPGKLKQRTRTTWREGGPRVITVPAYSAPQRRPPSTRAIAGPDRERLVKSPRRGAAYGWTRRRTRPSPCDFGGGPSTFHRSGRGMSSEAPRRHPPGRDTQPRSSTGAGRVQKDQGITSHDPWTSAHEGRRGRESSCRRAETESTSVHHR